MNIQKRTASGTLRIKGVQIGTRSKTLDLLFKTQFNEVISNSDLQIMYVTRKYIPAFREQRAKIMAG